MAYVPAPHAAQATPAPGGVPNVPGTQEQLAADVAAGGDTVLAGHAEGAVRVQLGQAPHCSGGQGAPEQNVLAGHGLQAAVVAFTSPHVPAGHAQLRALGDPAGDTDGAGHAMGAPAGQKKLAGHRAHCAGSVS